MSARDGAPVPVTLIAAAAMCAALFGCSRMQPGFQPLDTSALRIPRECGVQLAMMPGRPARYREMPPACTLPTPEDVARSCAVQDRVNTPGYVGSDCDGATGVCTPPDPPLPAYRVSGLECRFSNGDESAATCRFRLALPGEAGEGPAVEMPFDYRFVADHGPIHHSYSALWMLGRGADCTIDEPSQ